MPLELQAASADDGQVHKGRVVQHHVQHCAIKVHVHHHEQQAGSQVGQGGGVVHAQRNDGPVGVHCQLAALLVHYCASLDRADLQGAQGEEGVVVREGVGGGVGGGG